MSINITVTAKYSKDGEMNDYSFLYRYTPDTRQHFSGKSLEEIKEFKSKVFRDLVTNGLAESMRVDQEELEDIAGLYDEE